MGSVIETITCKSCSNSTNPENDDDENNLKDNIEASETLTFDYSTMLPKKVIDVKIKTKNFIKKRTDKIDDHYAIIKKLGEGAFGTVYMVENKTSKIKRAMKVISKDCILNGVDLQEVTNEIKILSLLDHPNIMKIYEFYEDNDKFYIISEFCDQGDIAEKMDKEGTLSEFIVKYFMNQVFRAVSYLHSQKIINGDIKSKAHAQKLYQKYPEIDGFMIGRGVFKNPFCFKKGTDGKSYVATKQELLNLVL